MENEYKVEETKFGTSHPTRMSRKLFNDLKILN